MTATDLLTAIARGLAFGLLWLVAGFIVALILGAIIPHADRNRDREQRQREPASERPTQILVISNHGADIYDAVQ